MNNFEELNLKPALAKAISELGYQTPTPIQSQTLPILLSKKSDFLGMAATGTGKTAAFGIPLLSSLDLEARNIQALILCPTRELAKQISDSLSAIGKYLKPNIVPIYGGAGYTEQIQGLRRGAQIVIATPGRLIDHLERGTINLSKVKTVILDEADEMISMGFKEDLETILEATHKEDAAEKANTWLFSATMHRDLRRVADRYMKDPETVEVNRSEMLSGTVEQVYYTLYEEDKPEAICRIIGQSDDFHGLIFCQTKAAVGDLARHLIESGFAAEQLHGEKSQTEREQTLKRFRSGKLKILVCTDVAARGLDVNNLTHVINYSLPRELDSYVHRIGRTGRRGIKGLALSLVTPSHFGLVGRIEKMTGSKMTKGQIPSAKDVAFRKLKNIFARFEKLENPIVGHELLNDEWQEFLNSKTKTEIAARLIAMGFPDLNVTGGREIGIDMSERRGGSGGGGRSRFSRGGSGGRPPRQGERGERWGARSSGGRREERNGRGKSYGRR